MIVSAAAAEDVKRRDELATHLVPLAQRVGGEVWHERRIAGGEPAAALDREIAQARAVVVMVSAELLADERRMALVAGALARGACVVPVIVRSCLWRETKLGDLEPLPRNGTMVLFRDDPGEVWNEVAAALEEAWKPADAAGRVRTSAGDVGARERPSGPPNNLPARRLFVGRRRELAEVHERLREGGAAAITQRATVFGLGGVGKTGLAIEYAHAHLAEYPGGVYWVRAEGDPVNALLAFSGELLAIAPPVVAAVLARMPSNDARAIATVVRLALQASTERALLVLDNVVADWSAHIPGGKVHVLITTRDPDLALGGRKARVRLDVLERDDALALAEEIAGACDAEDATERERVVLDQLGALAVAVEMAARAVAKWTGTWARYAIELAKEAALTPSSSALLEDPRLFGEEYRRGAFAAIDLSLARCTDPLARALLASLATLAAESAPQDWAEAGAGADTDTLATMGAWEALVEAGFVRVSPTDRSVALHRLVHRRLATTMTGEARHARAAAMAGGMCAWLNATVDAGRIREVEARVPHVEAVLGALDEQKDAPTWIGITVRLAAHLEHRGAYGVARSMLERALTAAEQQDAADESQVATLANNLANVLHKVGAVAGAKPLLERALRIGELAFGLEHPIVAIRLSNLAAVLDALGDASGARPLLERALRIGELAFGLEHPAVAIRLSNLATVLQHLGDAAAAKPLLERALRIDEHALGSEHPYVAIRLSNLATVLQDLGDAATARPLLERALRIQEQALGLEHPNVAINLSNLAMVLQELGDAAGARRLLERAVAVGERQLGADHPHTQLYRNNLASLLGSRFTD